MQKKKILHLITGLNTGGAEMMIYKLCKYKTPQVEYKVVSLTSLGSISKKIMDTGVPVEAIGLTKNPISFLRLFRLLIIIKRFNPSILQTWLYHADLIGALLGKILGVPVFWNIRQAKVDLNLNKRHTVYTAKLCARLSFLPKKIISCTQTGIEEHIKLGYQKDKFVCIPNGFEVQDPNIYTKRDKIILHIGRFAPLKDHATFIQTANLLQADLPDYEFHMYGDGVDESNNQLLELIESPNIKLLGRNDNLEAIYSKASLLISTSLSEGFSNTIGEAMLHDTPVLATDAGDSKYILDDPEMMIPAGSPEKIAKKTQEILDRNFKTNHFKNKITSRFAIQKVVELYEDLYSSSSKHFYFL